MTKSILHELTEIIKIAEAYSEGDLLQICQQTKSIYDKIGVHGGHVYSTKTLPSSILSLSDQKRLQCSFYLTKEEQRIIIDKRLDAESVKYISRINDEIKILLDKITTMDKTRTHEIKDMEDEIVDLRQSIVEEVTNLVLSKESYG